MRLPLTSKIVFFLILLCAVTASADSGDFTLVNQQPKVLTDKPQSDHSMAASTVYTGIIKVYMTETISRWRDHNNSKYAYGFMDFAFIHEVSVNDGAIFDTTVIWNATSAGYGDLAETNVTVMTAVFDTTGYLQDAYPGHYYWFLAHNTDAAASAHPGYPGRNYTGPDYTHTVLLEEATATY